MLITKCIWVLMQILALCNLFTADYPLEIFIVTHAQSLAHGSVEAQSKIQPSASVYCVWLMLLLLEISNKQEH